MQIFPVNSFTYRARLVDCRSLSTALTIVSDSISRYYKRNKNLSDGGLNVIYRVSVFMSLAYPCRFVAGQAEMNRVETSLLSLPTSES